MVREVVWRDQALADVELIKGYIARDSPTSAEKVVNAIEQAANQLADFPFAYRMIPEFQDPDRLRVVHGRRLLSNVPGSFEEPRQEARLSAKCPAALRNSHREAYGAA
jgi:plasmid stabilization system protein ParE